MKRIKKFLASLMVVVMVLTAAPLSGFVGLELNLDWFDFNTKASAATSGNCGDNLTWSFNESTGELVITGTGAMYDYDYNNRPWESYEDDIKTVTIGDSVTTIGDYAFYDCTSLASVTIPDSVATIGEDAFYFCNSLTSVTIGDSVTTIGNYAFEYCTSLTSITIPDSVTSIGYDAFYNCTSLTSITIPDSVTTIGNSAFYDCYSLTNVTIGDSVTTIGNSAFYGCDSLTSVEIPDSVTTIGNSAFSSCDSLKSVTIGDSVTTIGYEAFGYCTSLTNVTIGNSVTTIGEYAFYNTGYYDNDSNWEDGVLYIGNHLIQAEADVSGTYSIKEGTKCIADAAFESCESLESITIPDSVTTIGEEAFCGCDSLTSITIPDSVTTIGDWAFGYCYSLTNVTIPDSVTTIGEDAFRGCDILTNVTIGNSVTTIGNWAFIYCYSLTNVTIPDSVTTIGEDAFGFCDSLTNVTIPDSVTTIGEGAFGYCDSLTSITVDADNQYYSSDSYGVLYNKNKTKLIQYPIGNERTSFTIPDSVTTIGEGAFGGCDSLTSVEIPDSVTTIGEGAFGYCDSLTNVTIPDSVTTIGEYAFRFCYSLTSVEIPDSVTTIGDSAFRYCDSLTNVTIPDSVTTIGEYAFHFCDSLKSVTIGDSVTTIGYEAFGYCTSLTNVTIGNSVTTIGEYAFRYCDSLTDVYYSGTQEQWNKIAIGSSNGNLLNANIHFLNGMTISSSGVKTYSNDVVITPYGEKTFILNDDEFFDSKDYKRLTPATLEINSTSKNNSSKNPEFVISASEAQNNGVRLTSSGYRDYIIPEIVMNSWSTQVNLGSKNSAPGYVHNAYMQLDRKDGKPYISTVFGRKASVGEYVELKTSELKVKKDTKYDIVISLGGIDDSESYTYYLSQNENNKIQNSTGVFDARTLTDIFKDGKAIYAYAKSESGVTTELQQVNIIIEEEITSTLDFINSSTFNLLGPDFAKITIPSSVPLIGEAEISFEAFKMPAGFEYDGESLKVSIGANIFNANTELKKNSPTKYKKWSTECFNDWKSMTKTTSEAISKTEEGHKEAKDSYSKAKKNFSNKWGNIASKNKTKNWDVDFLGYIDAAIVNGELVVKEAFISVEGSFTFKYTVQGAIWVIPAYCYVEAGGSLGAEAVGSRVIIDSDVPFEWDLTIKLEPEVTIGGGVGVDDVLSAGIYANATLPIRLDVTNNHLIIQLTGEIGVEAEAWVLKAKKKLLSGTLDVVDTYYGKQTRFVTQSNPITGEEETYIITYEICERDYLENTSQWYGDDVNFDFDSVDFSQGGMTFETLQSSVFSSAKPKVVSFDDKMLMTWIEDDGTRDTYNRMRLMYSVYDGGIWSEPRAVYDNGCNDNEPVIVTDGEDVYFAWQKLSKQLTEDDVMSVNAVVENCEIYIAKYDSSEDAITGAKRVTDNSVYDYAHNISVINGMPYVYWVTCNDNNMESGSDNTLKKASFDGTTSVVKSNLNYILDLDAAYINGKENVSYSMDGDGNTLTANDINVFTLVEGVSTVFEKKSDVAYTTAFYGEFSGENVLFVSDMSNIYYVEGGEVKAVLDHDRTTLSNINYVDNNGEGIFIWTENNGAGNDVYSSTFENGSWTTPIVISNEESALLTSIDTTMYKGQFRGVCMSTDLVLNEETQVYEISQTDLCSFTIAEMQDIAVDSIMIDERDIEISKEASFDVYVTNNGSETIKTVTFTVSDGLGFTKTFTKEVNLASGDYKAVTLTYMAPENYSATELNVTVSCAEIADEKSDNDTTSVKIGTPKIILSESSVYALGSDYIITAVVTNESDLIAQNVDVLVSFDSGFSDICSEFTIEELGARESSIIEFVVPRENVEFDENGIAKVYLTAELGDMRSNNVCILLESNNTECEHPVTEEIVIDSDCCEVGKRTVICSGCGETLSETEIPKKSHNYVNGVCTECEGIATIYSRSGSKTVVDYEKKIIYGLKTNISIDTITSEYVNLSDTVYYEYTGGVVATGKTISLYDKNTNSFIDKYTFVIVGDVNGDGWYDGQDAIIVDCLANGMLTQDDVSEAVYIAADCNHDGTIDALDVALLEQAGALLASVDQSKSTEVLLETSAEYVEYIDLIDQSPEIESEDESENVPEADVVNPEQDKTEMTIIEVIICFIKSIFEMIIAHIPVLLK